jgi:hypothetical protein
MKLKHFLIMPLVMTFIICGFWFAGCDSTKKYNLGYESGFADGKNDTDNNAEWYKFGYGAGYTAGFAGGIMDEDNNAQNRNDGYVAGFIDGYNARVAELSAHVLPIVQIATQNGALPTNKVDYVNSSFALSNAADANHNFNVPMQANYGDSNSVGIRLRGNSTMTFTKKPYRVKFDKKRSCFGSVANKSWVLLADYLDVSLIKNYTAMQLARQFDNMPWNAYGTHVVLYLNGEYKGVYFLCDQIDEKDGRLDLEGGYENGTDFTTDGLADYSFYVEVSHDHLDDPTTDPADVFHVTDFVTSSRYPMGSPAEIKYPAAGDGRCDDATTYIINYVNAVFSALNGDDFNAFDKIVDTNSFVDFMILNELLMNADAHWKSIYVSKKIGEKLTFGPVWDFDVALGVGFSGNPLVDQTTANVVELQWELNKCIFAPFFEMAGETGFEMLQARFAVLAPKIEGVYRDLIMYREYLARDGAANSALWYDDGEHFAYHYGTVGYALVGHFTYLKVVYMGSFDAFMSAVDAAVAKD